MRLREIVSEVILDRGVIPKIPHCSKSTKPLQPEANNQIYLVHTVRIILSWIVLSTNSIKEMPAIHNLWDLHPAQCKSMIGKPSPFMSNLFSSTRQLFIRNAQ
jgi:hypothetical protein